MHTNSTRPDLPAEQLSRIERRVAGVAARLRAAGLHDLVGGLLDAAQPLGPLGAQMLWIAQPALGLVVSGSSIHDLAQVLDDPAGVAWLRAELIGVSGDSEQSIDCNEHCNEHSEEQT